LVHFIHKILLCGRPGILLDRASQRWLPREINNVWEGGSRCSKRGGRLTNSCVLLLCPLAIKFFILLRFVSPYLRAPCASERECARVTAGARNNIIINLQLERKSEATSKVKAVSFNLLTDQLKIRKQSFFRKFFYSLFFYTQKYINKSWKKTQKISLFVKKD